MSEMLDSTFSSTDNSPHSSPFQSPVTSPASSRGTSPTRSPRLHLKRADSYRKSGRRASTKMDDIIRRRKVMVRTRSQSDTDVNDDEKESVDQDSAKMRRKKKSISEDFTDKFKIIRPDSTYSEKSLDSRPSTPGTPDRKKSLSQMLDFRRIMDLSPKLHRSHKTQNAHSPNLRRKAIVNHQDDDDGGEGPLIKATTMWVPGYDYKTKQHTSYDDRQHAKNMFSRRGSKDKSLVSLLEKVNSSPNLMRRGSKDKLEKHVVDQVKAKARYTRRCDSLPLSDSQTNKLHAGLTKSKSSNSNNNNEIAMSISERSAIIAQKHIDFEDRKKPLKQEKEPPVGLISRGSVKKISVTFEDGSIYTEVKDQKSSVKTRKFSGEYDNIVRTRTESFESGEAFQRNNNNKHNNNNKYPYTTTYDNFADSTDSTKSSRNGLESGYASPTESTLSEISITSPPKINVIPTDYNTNSCRDSWRRGSINWDDKFDYANHLSPPESRSVKLTNLCVTEL